MNTRLPVLASIAAIGSVIVAGTLGSSSSGSGVAPAHTVNGTAGLQLTSEVSSNWSGYVSTGIGSTPTTASTTTTFKNATATWKQPTATCAATGTASASAVWVGLGGYSTSSAMLEQTGTAADCSATGKPSYYAWYEVVPAPSFTVKSLKISPGDLITASVVVNGNEVLMQVKNRTRKTVFTKRTTVTSPDLSSAEWIAEAPSECSSTGYCGQIPLANFGSVTFTKVAALATIAGLGDQGGTVASPLWQSTAIQLVPQGRERYFGDRFDRPDVTTGTAGATPFGLTTGGDSFGVNWVADATTLG